MEIIPVIPSLLSGQALSAAKDLASLPPRSFAALRMTCRTPLEAAHGKSSLQMSNPQAESCDGESKCPTRGQYRLNDENDGKIPGKQANGCRGAIHCARGHEAAPQQGAMNCAPTPFSSALSGKWGDQTFHKKNSSARRIDPEDSSRLQKQSRHFAPFHE